MTQPQKPDIKCGSYDCPEGLDPFTTDPYAGDVIPEDHEMDSSRFADQVLRTKTLCAQCMSKGNHRYSRE